MPIKITAQVKISMVRQYEVEVEQLPHGRDAALCAARRDYPDADWCEIDDWQWEYIDEPTKEAEAEGKR